MNTKRFDSTTMFSAGQDWVKTRPHARTIFLLWFGLVVVSIAIGFSFTPASHKWIIVSIAFLPVIISSWIFAERGGLVSATILGIVIVVLEVFTPGALFKLTGVIAYFPVLVLIPCGYLLGKYMRSGSSILQELSDLRRSHKQLIETKNRFQLLFENAGDAIFVHTFDGELLDANHAARRMLGLERKDLNAEMGEWMHLNDSNSGSVQVHREIVETGYHVYEAGLTTKAGKTIPAELNSRTVEYMGRLCLLTIARDITKAIRDHQLLSLQRDLALNFSQAISMDEILHILIQELGKDGDIDSGCVLVPADSDSSYSVISEIGNSYRLARAENGFSFQFSRLPAQGVWFGTGDELSPLRDTHNSKLDTPLGFAALPIVSENWRGTGYVLLCSHKHKAFSEDTRLMLESIATQINAGIGRVIAEERLIESNAELVKLSEELRSLNEGLEESVADRTEALLLANSRYRKLFERIPTPLYRTSIDGIILDANPAMVELLGFPNREELLATNAANLYEDPAYREKHQSCIDTGDLISGEDFVLRRYDGTTIWVRDHAHAVRNHDNEILYFEGSLIDVTEQKRYEARLVHDAYHDPLTGLPNRSKLIDSLKNLHLRTTRLRSYRCGVIFVDLDDFKNVNDTYGHPVGDMLLISLARRLENVCRVGDMVCRYGGDEFVILVENIGSQDDIEKLAQRIFEEITSPFHIRGESIRITASLGCINSSCRDANPDKIIDIADKAMYAAKDGGKHRVEYIKLR